MALQFVSAIRVQFTRRDGDTANARERGESLRLYAAMFRVEERNNFLAIKMSKYVLSF